MCIICVIVTHLSWTVSERLNPFFPFFIDMAVPFFMIVSGFLYASSYSKKNITNFDNAYSFNNIIPSLLRLTVPYIIAFCISWIAIIVHNNANFSFMKLCSTFLSGGFGPGSYYYPIMIQFIFVFPIIYFTIKAKAKNGLLLCFLFNAIFELLKRAYSMNAECYRLLVFRYVSLIAIGCYFFIYGVKVSIKSQIILLLIGISYIVLRRYFNIPVIFINYWEGTCFIATTYIIPIFIFLYNQFYNVSFKPLELVGKASFNIFLTQAVFYSFLSQRVLKFNIVHNTIIAITINVVIGIIFYRIEQPITNKVKSLVLSFK